MVGWDPQDTTPPNRSEKPESENRKSPESRTTKGKTKPEKTEKTRRPDQILYRIALVITIVLCEYPEQDYVKSLYWLEKVAEQGYQEANYLVGTRYEDGCGTEKDVQKAIFWYRRAPSYGPALSRLNELTKPQS